MTRRRNTRPGYRSEDKIVRQLDDLAEFEHFRDVILPALREDLRKGMSAEEIFSKYEAHAAAATVSALATEDRLPAADKILNRTMGKPTEKKEVTHKLGKLSDEQLDALLQSELTDVDTDGEESLPKH